MPLHHHGRTPHTKAQQRKRINNEIKLEQAAGQTRRDVDAEPFNDGRWERAVTTYTAGHAPAPTAGGTLSATEEAAALNLIADVTDGLAAQLQSISTELEAQLNSITNALGAGHSRLTEAQAPFQQAQTDVSALAVAIGAAAGTVRGVASQLS